MINDATRKKKKKNEPKTKIKSIIWNFSLSGQLNLMDLNGQKKERKSQGFEHLSEKYIIITVKQCELQKEIAHKVLDTCVYK